MMVVGHSFRFRLCCVLCDRAVCFVSISIYEINFDRSVTEAIEKALILIDPLWLFLSRHLILKTNGLFLFLFKLSYFSKHWYLLWSSALILQLFSCLLLLSFWRFREWSLCNRPSFISGLKLLKLIDIPKGCMRKWKKNDCTVLCGYIHIYKHFLFKYKFSLISLFFFGSLDRNNSWLKLTL